MASLAFEERVAMLVDAQWHWRENRAMTTRLGKAKLKHAASMEDINFRLPRELDRAQMRSLADCEWVRQHQNITITGAAGLGKTWLCCALLQKACREGFSARFFAAPKFFRQLAVAYADGSFDNCRSLPESTSWPSTTGASHPWATWSAGIFSKSWMTGMNPGLRS